MNIKRTFLKVKYDWTWKVCVVPSQDNKVCKLLKSLYGLKEALKQWHEKLDNVLHCDDFSTNDPNKCV